MSPQELVQCFRSLTRVVLSRPGAGSTAERHTAIFAAGRKDLSLAKLIEAHWDAVAILNEAGMQPVEGAAYAVWASELPGTPMRLENGALVGTKQFCSGASLVNRALVAAGPTLVEVDLALAGTRLRFDESQWSTDAFRMTRTASVTFDALPVASVIGEDNWYTRRTGFWQGACGPAAAWAGGAAGLLDYAVTTKRNDPHTMAHLGAMHANVRAMESILKTAADCFDRGPEVSAMTEALAVRHTTEQLSTDTLRRFARALGPAPLVKDANVARRYAELDLFLRQSHAERDLEILGTELQARRH